MPPDLKRTKEMKQRVKELVESGMSQSDIGREIGVSRQRVHQIVSNFHMEKRLPTYKDLESQVTAMLIDCRAMALLIDQLVKRGCKFSGHDLDTIFIASQYVKAKDEDNDQFPANSYNG